MFLDVQDASGERHDVATDVRGKTADEIASIVWRLLSADRGSKLVLEGAELKATTFVQELTRKPIAGYDDLATQAESLAVQEAFSSAEAALMGVMKLATERGLVPLAILTQDPQKLFGGLRLGGTRVFGVKVFRDATLDIGQAFVAVFGQSHFAELADATLLARFFVESSEK